MMANKIEWDRFHRWTLYLFAFCIPNSISLSQALLGIFLLTALGRQSIRLNLLKSCRGVMWAAVAFGLWAALTVLWSERPGASAAKLHRLLYLLLIVAVPALCRTSAADIRSGVIKAFLLGAGVSVVVDLIRIPREVMAGTPLFDTASMTDPQFYMTALALLIPPMVFGCCRASRGFCWGLLALNGVGLLAHFKRGSWLAFGAVLVVFAALTRRWKILLALAIAALAMTALPQVRHRLAALPDEFTEMQGGRGALWFKVAPELIRQYPMGMGWRATRKDDFQGYARYVQPELNHLHNNPLQVTLETGWVGLALWLLWMGGAGSCGMRACIRLRGCGDPEAMAQALSLFLAFLALHLNGLVEFNFGDGEILLLYSLLMALIISIDQNNDMVCS